MYGSPMQSPAARNVAPLTIRQHLTNTEIALLCKTSHRKTSPAAKVSVQRKLDLFECILALLLSIFVILRSVKNGENERQPGDPCQQRRKSRVSEPVHPQLPVLTI